MDINLVSIDLEREPLNTERLLKLEVNLGGGKMLTLQVRGGDLYITTDEGRIILEPVASNAVRVRSESGYA